jgi:secreted trypsin-like serine protease
MMRVFFLILLMQLGFSSQIQAIEAENQEPISLKIIGGRDATLNEYPWFVGLLNSKNEIFCGGSLISQTQVLTAAHCVSDNNDNLVRASAIKVWVGAYDLGDSSIGKVYNLKKITRHPDYDSSLVVHDLAILDISGRVADVEPLEMANTRILSELTSSQELTVIGFGTIVDNPLPSIQPDVLQEVNLTYVSDQICHAIVKKYHSDRLSNARQSLLLLYPNIDELIQSNLCTAGDGENSDCDGDSGGPLVVQSSGKWYQIGLVSYGLEESCAVDGVPAVYARINKDDGFIKNNLDTSVSSGFGGINPQGTLSGGSSGGAALLLVWILCLLMPLKVLIRQRNK